MSNRQPRVLDVGNCDPDHASLRQLLIHNFEVDVDRVMFVNEALEALAGTGYTMVFVNRLIFADSSEGLTLIKQMRADDTMRDTPVMMISNYADAQDRAVAAGAVRGFGKADLTDAATVGCIEAMVRELLPGAVLAGAPGHARESGTGVRRWPPRPPNETHRCERRVAASDAAVWRNQDGRVALPAADCTFCRTRRRRPRST
ncbi:MAG: hypothetical protein IID39_08255 [Planctomycetes bacterium]|nr:hypothetical protein [Planctomycetota bacterium]